MARDDRTSADGAFEDLDAAAFAYFDRSAAAASADERATLRDEFTIGCLTFAGRLARRYRGRGEAVEDLEQVARMGLVKAIDRYEPGRGSFTAYAVMTITGEIKRYFRDKAWGVHVPRGLQDLSLAARRAGAELTGELARTPTRAEVADRLGVSEYEVIEAVKSSRGYAPMSLNTPVTGGDGSYEFGDLLATSDHALESVDDKLTLSTLLLRLPARDRHILALRFYGNRTQTEIAAELGISQMHVSRLLTRALTWLRGAMLNDVLPPWEGTDLPDHQGLELTSRRDDGVLIVRTRGELDRDTSGRLRAALHNAVAARPERVIVDLVDVPLVDAAGVAALLDAASAAGLADVGLRLTGARPYVFHVLKVSGLAKLLSDDERR